MKNFRKYKNGKESENKNISQGEVRTLFLNLEKIKRNATFDPQERKDPISKWNRTDSQSLKHFHSFNYLKSLSSLHVLA